MNIPLLFSLQKNKLFSERNVLNKILESFIFLSFFFLGNLYLVNAQAPLPYVTKFETSTEKAGWVLLNGTSENKWFIGIHKDSNGNDSSNELYISNNRTTNNYSNTASIVHAYRDITIPTAVSYVNIKYAYQVLGNSKDYFRVWLVSTSSTIQSGTQITAAPDRILFQSGQKNASWLNFQQSVDVSVFAGGTMRIVFEWINTNTTVNNTAIAIDIIEISKFTPCSPTSGGNMNSRKITNVKFLGTLNPSTENNTVTILSPNRYGDYRGNSSKAKQIPGGAINLAVDITASSVEGRIKAWVDWNKDGVYEDLSTTDPKSEKIYDPSEAGINVKDVVFGFIVPVGTLPGFYNIRIRVNNSTANFGPCFNISSDGETEDYSFEVVEDVATKIVSAPTVIRCGEGPATLTATGTNDTTSYRWYKTQFGEAIFGENKNSYKTPESLPVRPKPYTYYVTAVNGTTESAYRTPINVVVSPTPTIQFSKNIPAICGEGNVIKISSSADKQEVTLLEDNFDGTLEKPLKFINIFNGNNSVLGKWQIRSSPFRPGDDYKVLKPAISSGYNGGQFANMITDVSRNNLMHNYYVTDEFINASGITSLKMDFDLYYLPEQNGSEDFAVEYSINGGSWKNLKTYKTTIGEPGTFERQSIALTDCEGLTNIKLRFSLKAAGSKNSNGNNSWTAQIAAIDNIRVYGNKDLPAKFTWSGNTTGLFAGSCDGPKEVGESVCIKPTAYDIEHKEKISITATAKLANGCTISETIWIDNNTKVWNASNSSTDWNTTGWQPNNAVPTDDKCVIIKTPIVLGISANGLAKNIIVKTDGALNIESGASLTVTDFFKNEYKENNVESGNNVVIESGGNFIQTNDNAPNIGSLTTKRTISLTNNTRQQYNYVISPVENFSLAEIYKGAAGNTIPSPAVLYHNEGTNKFKNSSGAYIKGRALAVKEPAVGFAENSISATFHGRPVNGLFTYTLINSNSTDSNRGYNLIGNPYPSNMDLIQFYKDNSAGGTLSPTFYLWDNKANAQTVQMGDKYGGQAYALFNASTPPEIGTPTKAAGDNTDVAGVKLPTRYVTVGQGFMTKVINASSKLVTFKNTLRTAESATGFFGRGDTNENSVNRYWLNLISPANIASNIAVVYFAEGINAFTQDDSRSMGGSDALYSLVDEEKVSINGKSSFTNSDVVLLGSTHFATGSYTIALDKMEGVFANGQNIYLKDKQAKTVTNLSAGPYTFAAEAGQSTERFEIIYKPDTVLVTDASIKETLIVYRDGNDFVIKSQSKKIGGLEIYDAAGRLMDSRFPNQKEVRIEGGKFVNGIYLLKITQDGKVTTKKIIR